MFFKLLNKVSKQNTSWNVKRDNGCRENTAIVFKKQKYISNLKNSFQKYIAMAAEGGEFGYDDKVLDSKLDNDDVATNKTTNTSQGFEPITFSTPYHRGEQHEMQTMQHEQSGLPSYDESTPLLSTSDIEKRLRALRTDPFTGIIDTSKMDASINPLTEEDRAKQIERVKSLIKANYPNVKFGSLVIEFLQKKPNGYCGFGPKGRRDQSSFK